MNKKQKGKIVRSIFERAIINERTLCDVYLGMDQTTFSRKKNRKTFGTRTSPADFTEEELEQIINAILAMVKDVLKDIS